MRVIEQGGNLSSSSSDCLGFSCFCCKFSIKKAPEPVSVRPMAVAASRNRAAARLELGRVLDDRILPSELLLPGDKQSHDVKCLSVGHFDMSVQHSETSFNAR